MLRDKKRALLCANPTAQSGKAGDTIDRARAALEERGFDVEVLHTEPAGRTSGLVTARLDGGLGLDVVVALGGDGTFRDIGKGILAASRRCPLGLIPAGTANDQAKSLGIPVGELAADVDIIDAGHVLHLDVGVVQLFGADPSPGGAAQVLAEEVFFDSVSFGFQAEVLHKRNEDKSAIERVPLLRELYRDHAVYGGALLDGYLRSFVEPTKMAAIITADGRKIELESILDLVVKNTAIYGGAWVLARDSAPDDGVMEVVPFVNRRELFSKIITDLSKLPDLEEVLHALGVEHSRAFSASELDIRLVREARPAVASQLDGEAWLPAQHVRVSVKKGLLPVLAPAGFDPPWRRSASAPP